MCRIAGYLGAPTTLDALLSAPPHSLRSQGHSPRELPPGKIGSDGYGVAWYTSPPREPARYRQTLPIWVDDNLETLAPHVSSHCFVAGTRTATPEMPVAITNTPPFLAGRTALVHNGSIDLFHERVVEPMRAMFSAATRVALRGNSDSEYLAALLGEIEGPSLEARVKTLLERVGQLVRETRTEAQLNLIVIDGHQLVAVRHALGADAPTLYSTTRTDGSVVVSSEPMSAQEDWTRFASDTMLTVQRGAPSTLTRLPD